MKDFMIILLLALFSTGQGYETVCYGQLGCFTDAPPWGSTDERPVGYLPQDPSEVNTQFFLDTRKAKGVEVFSDDMSTLGATSFDRRKPTKFIIHGFISNGDTTALTTMSDALLSKEDLNIIRISWVGGSMTINYALSATDTQIVGAEVALFITNIVNTFGGSTKDYHCIGHSLGAQACGYAGAKVSPKMARISGLDPAGPYFENTPFEVRLDSTDADFVDVIHTDAEKLINFGYGINQISGDIDFWPNDGIEQPGCDQNILSTIIGVDGIADGTMDFVACNHLRVLDFYIESITSSCPFTSNACNSYSDYLSGKCLYCPSGNCVSMGYHSIDNANQALQSNLPSSYLQTRSFAPFCEYMTYIQVTLGSNSDGVEGKLFVTLYGSSSNTEQVQLSDEDVELDLRPSNTYSYVAQYSKIPSGFNRIKILWTQEEFTAFSQYITIDQVSVWVDSEQKTYQFCGNQSVQMAKETRYSLYVC